MVELRGSLPKHLRPLSLLTSEQCSACASLCCVTPYRGLKCKKLGGQQGWGLKPGILLGARCPWYQMCTPSAPFLLILHCVPRTRPVPTPTLAHPSTCAQEGVAHGVRLHPSQCITAQFMGNDCPDGTSGNFLRKLGADEPGEYGWQLWACGRTRLFLIRKWGPKGNTRAACPKS